MPLTGHLDGTKKLCVCKGRGCDKFLDENGDPGVQLDQQTYNRHQKAERSRKNKEEREARQQAAELAKPDPDRYGALARQAAIIEEKERELESALSSLSIHDIGPPLVHGLLRTAEHPINPESKYRIEKERDMAEYFSRMLADADAHTRNVMTFNIPPTSHKSDEDIQNALRACEGARSFVTGTRQRLVWTDKGRHRRDPAVKLQREEMRDVLSRLEKRVEEVDSVWRSFQEKRDEELAKVKMRSGMTYDSSHHFATDILGGSSSIIQLVVFMVVVGHVILGFSERACRWLFSMCGYIIQTAVMKADPHKQMERYFNNVLQFFPRDPATATNQFKLEGKATIFAVCTACDATHEPTIVNNIPTYPERCKNRVYSNPCGKLLVRPKVVQGRKIFVPIKKYVAFDFHDWVADLLSRTGNESKMDAAWERSTANETDSISDIFQGSRILEFKGSDGKHFSETGGEGTGRYLFSLGLDFFNPLRNLAAGKKISIGVIALICLNLPIEIRYKPENVFLAGIIPGPKEPSLDAINPYLKPVVNAFLSFWVGVFFTKTILYPLGRLIICALLLLVCDLPAARKAGGFSACNHEFFCSVCWCTKTAHGYNNFDHKSWKRRTDEECREYAQAFRTEVCKKKSLRIFDTSGIRYSELHRLPYFDATRSVVVDPMHNLFLGLIKDIGKSGNSI